ncbi:hypothetical protein [Luedemannella helvata]|uniref:YncI copper-binding domain-containing protein n=1 Tax=Luedemannella helvata TaxID=349315 RepID=A0ABP4X896_9ACTN
MTRTARWTAAIALGVAAALPVAGVAYAHVDVRADKARALATNVTVTFVAAAESATSGIKSVRVVLPDGIAPADVSLVSAPSGWKLTTTDDGYQVAGAAQPTGRNVTHKVKLAQLPDERSLTFKTLVTYGNNDVDRWIGDPDSENPAPVLKLQAAATRPPATTAAPTTAAPTTAAPTTAPAATEPTGVVSISPGPVSDEEESSGTFWWWVIGLGVLAGALTAGYLAARRRRLTG